MPDDLLLRSILFIILLFFSGLFSSSETAIFSVKRSKLEEKMRGGHPEAFRLLALLKFPRKLLIAILTGNTFVNIAMTVISASVARDIANYYQLSPILSVLVQVFAVTLLILIVGEILPKIIAVRNAIRHSLRMSSFLTVIYALLKPLTAVFYWITELFARMFHIQGEEFIEDSDELSALVNLSGESGAIREKERDMIQSLLKLSDTRVREIMIPRPDIHSIDINQSLPDIIREVRESKFSRLPVHGGDLDHIIGFIFLKDILHLTDKETGKAHIKSLLRPPLFVHENKSVAKMLREFQTKKTKLAIVVDEFGGTSGLVTLEDVVEEIVGEIQDEMDEENQLMIRQDGEREYIVDAALNLDELEEELGLSFPEERDYDTLGGFVMDKLGRVPKKQDQFVFQNVRYTVVLMQRRRIKEIRLEFLPKE
ncbi:MAG: HlyC/CorC family transporter [Candidatus Marinimicrobia bacterium]|nr:HlyC/CorC family transporter [Candidatus Neomarinimicrobiota bacterium]